MTHAPEAVCWFHLEFDLLVTSWNYVMAERMWVSTLPFTQELLAASSIRQARSRRFPCQAKRSLHREHHYQQRRNADRAG
jgi:hypothetical protein